MLFEVREDTLDRLASRLVALILAPSGRGAEAPSEEGLQFIVDSFIPGLAAVLEKDQPMFRIWPEQLSAKGFVRAFFARIKLPGEKGKGTPWCSIAGRFDIGERQLLAGLVCRASKPNGLSQIAIQGDALWHEVLRVRNG